MSSAKVDPSGGTSAPAPRVPSASRGVRDGIVPAPTGRIPLLTDTTTRTYP